jgi:hypothetical protein
LQRKQRHFGDRTNVYEHLLWRLAHVSFINEPFPQPLAHRYKRPPPR